MTSNARATQLASRADTGLADETIEGPCVLMDANFGDVRVEDYIEMDNAIEAADAYWGDGKKPNWKTIRANFARCQYHEDV